MIGTVVNAGAVICGTGLGVLLKKGIPQEYQQTIMQGMGLSILLIGLQMAFKTNNILIVIFSMVFGAVIGEALTIERRLNNLGKWVTARLSSSGDDVGKGFISASLVYCVGAMAVVGSIQEGMSGDSSTLYAKSILDGVTAVVFASTMGIGVGLSAISILLYQGTITMLAGWFSTIFHAAMINEITAVGGLLIMGIALTMLEIRKINVANLLPAIPVAALIALLWSR